MNQTMNNEKPNKPILTQVYGIIGVICLILAVFSVMVGIQNESGAMGILLSAGAPALVGIFSLGIAQVIHLIAKIEFNTRKEEDDDD